MFATVVKHLCAVLGNFLRLYQGSNSYTLLIGTFWLVIILGIDLLYFFIIIIYLAQLYNASIWIYFYYLGQRQCPLSCLPIDFSIYVQLKGIAIFHPRMFSSTFINRAKRSRLQNYYSFISGV